MRKLKTLSMILIIFNLLIPFSVLATAPLCVKEKAEFRDLYIKLQQSLNYEGTDAKLVKNKSNKDVLVLERHQIQEGISNEDSYGGKVFEKALYKEYQNSLRKVALLYQSQKLDPSNLTVLDDSPAANFFKAIENKDDTTAAAYIKANKVEDVIDSLAKASQGRIHPLTDTDKYLLKKLLTHAQDRTCTVKNFEKGKPTNKFIDVRKERNNIKLEDYLTELKNAPLNRLMKSIRDANITKDSDFTKDADGKNVELKDTDMAIYGAIKANMKNLKDWMDKNKKKCMAAISNPNFIQANIQGCNYKNFLNALKDNNYNQIEALLQFINSNEKFLKNPQAKAETSLDENELENFIGKTFNNDIICTRIGGQLFVTNLPYNKDKKEYDTSKIKCSRNGQDLTAEECKANLEITQDELGHGTAIKQKKTKTKTKQDQITFSIDRPSPNCKAPPTTKDNKNEQKEKEKKTNSALTLTIKEGDGTATPLINVWGPSIKSGEVVNLSTGPDCTENVAKGTAKDNGTVDIAMSALPESKDLTLYATLQNNAEAKGQRSYKWIAKCPDGAIAKTDAPSKCECIKTEQVFDQGGKKCIDKITPQSAEEECIKKHNAYLASLSGDQPPIPRYIWDTSVKPPVCKDKQAEKSKGDDQEGENLSEKDETIYADKPVPGRFQPVQIPTRQMYILPGMP